MAMVTGFSPISLRSGVSWSVNYVIIWLLGWAGGICGIKMHNYCKSLDNEKCMRNVTGKWELMSEIAENGCRCEIRRRVASTIWLAQSVLWFNRFSALYGIYTCEPPVKVLLIAFLLLIYVMLLHIMMSTVRWIQWASHKCFDTTNMYK